MAANSPIIASTKTTHLITALATLVALAISFWLIPELRKNSVATFSSVGAFLSFYALIFAIVEVLRVRSAAVDALNAAQAARDAVLTAYSLRGAAECQSNIAFALRGLDAGDIPGSAALNHIGNLYAAEFHVEMAREDSLQRKNVAMLQSYAMATRPGASHSMGKLKKALMGMSSDVSTRQQSAISKEAIK